MTPTVRRFIVATALLWLLLGRISGSARAQSDNLYDSGTSAVDSSTDSGESTTRQVFFEIELSPEGVSAYDSLGAEWIYDFDRDRFVAGVSDRSGETTSRERNDREETVEPVEIRCVEEKVVAYPALRAVNVGWDEYVDGDIVANGRVTINGWVKGSVQSFSKIVLVTSTGRVDGDIRAPQIRVKEGGVVLGEQVITKPLHIPVNIITDKFSTAGIWIVFGFTLALSLISFLASSLAPRQVGNITDCVNGYPVRSSLYGFLFLCLSPLIVVMVCLTIVGLFFIWLVPLAYLVAFGLGLGQVGHRFIALVLKTVPSEKSSPVLSPLSGVWLFMALWALVAVMLGSCTVGSAGYRALGVFLLVVSIVASAYAFLLGIGAVVLTRFGFRQYVGYGDREVAGGAAAPTPPPMPQGPSPVPRSSAELPPAMPRPPRPPRVPDDSAGQ